MRAGRNEASTVARLEAVPNSGGQAGLVAVAGMKAVRGKIEGVNLAAAVEIEGAVGNGGGLTVVNHASAARSGKRRSHCPKLI